MFSIDWQKTAETGSCRLINSEPENWPPNSLDLKLVDYSIWRSLQQMVYRYKISDIYQLKRVLIGCWAQLSQDALNRSIAQLPKKSSDGYQSKRCLHGVPWKMEPLIFDYNSRISWSIFLQRSRIACNAERCISHGNSVCVSVQGRPQSLKMWTHNRWGTELAWGKWYGLVFNIRRSSSHPLPASRSIADSVF